MVVHVISNVDASSGGPTTAVVELAREQGRSGESIRVVLDRSNEDPSWVLRRWEGLDVSLAGAETASGSAAMRRYLSDQRPRVVHLHGVWDPIVRRAAAAAASVGMPWVVSTHGMLHPAALEKSALKKRAYLIAFGGLVRRARCVLALNAEEAAFVRQRHGTRVVVAPSGIDPAPYDLAMDGSFARSVPGLDGRTFMLFLGRLDWIKGIDLLLEAFGVAVAEGLGSHLVLAGPDHGAERDLRAHVHRLRLGDRVHFVGPLAGNRKLRALGECEAFAHRPRYEGFGIAVAEAMAAGRPVVTTPACRLDGAADQGAIVCVADRTEDFARALLRVSADPGRARELGGRARDWVRENLAWGQVLRRVEEGYRP